MKIIRSFLALLLVIGFMEEACAQIPFDKNVGRIVISSDGNYGDDDDWGATAAMLMMLAKAGLQDKLVLYTYSDHTWGNNSASDVQHMRTSINGSNSRWNFNSTMFIEAVSDTGAAYNAMRDAINASSAGDKLYIICAGPMQVVGSGLQRADAAKRQYVTLISHSSWNDEHGCTGDPWEPHSGWCWDQLKSAFPSANFIHIADQNSSSNPNVGFSTGTSPNQWSYWFWMRDHPDATVRWVYERMQTVNRADISDAGMVWYLLHGDQYGNPVKLKNFIGNGIGTLPSNTR